jgi:hypothetical protein
VTFVPFSFRKGEPDEFEGLTPAGFGSLQFGQAFIEPAHARAMAKQLQTLPPWTPALGQGIGT